MTDREMFEFAAKAAGWDTNPWVWSERINAFRYLLNGDWVWWNPRDDDSDSFRLMVRLGIDLLFTAENVEAVATQHARPHPWACESWTVSKDHPRTATRRAIFRVAAEIGKGMK